MQYEEFINFLESQSVNRVDLGLDKIKTLLAKLGNPHTKLRCIHVAGTNGKGSVCAMLSYVLSKKYKVGLYISPHLVDYTERIQIFTPQKKAENISKEDIVRIFNKVYPYLDGQSYFEITTAIAFLYFLEQNVDIVVLETGLGGRLDATNVIIPEVCAITALDIDHKDFLGDTIEQITAEKAGIIKDNVPVVISKTNSKNNIKKILEEKAEKTNSDFYIAGLYNGKLSLNGEFQKENAGVVVEVIKHLKRFIVDERYIAEGLQQAFWPARLEWRNKNLNHSRAAGIFKPQIGIIDIAAEMRNFGPNLSNKKNSFQTILIDGAHNVSGIKQLIKYVKKEKTNRKIKKVNVLCSFLTTKEYEKMIILLNCIADNIILTSIPHHNSIDPNNLVHLAKNGRVVIPPIKALEASKRMTMEEDLLVVTGSLYLIGHLYEWI